jgi:hypothetical protein
VKENIRENNKEAEGENKK